MNEIRKIYLVHFLVGLTNIASVTFTLYFLSHGLSQFQIAQFFSIFMITMAIFNIPTGAIADTFGHKHSVFVGLMLQSASFFLFFAYPNYWGILLGFLASGLGLSFQAGALSALIYEILKKENLHSNFQKVTGRTGGLMLIGAVIGAPIGSIIYKSNQSLPYFLAFLFMFFASLIAFNIKWELRRRTNTIASYFKTMSDGLILTFKNKILIGIIIIGSALTINRLIFNQNIVQPYVIGIGIDVSYLGFIIAVISLFSALISFNSQKIYKILGRELALLVIFLVPSFCLFLLSLINSVLALPLILFFVTGHVLRDPVFAHITQGEYTDDKRSTMGSTIGFLTAIIPGVFLPVWGKGLDILGISSTLFLLGVFTIIFGAFGFYILQSKK